MSWRCSSSGMTSKWTCNPLGPPERRDELRRWMPEWGEFGSCFPESGQHCQYPKCPRSQLGWEGSEKRQLEAKTELLADLHLAPQCLEHVFTKLNIRYTDGLVEKKNSQKIVEVFPFKVSMHVKMFFEVASHRLKNTDRVNCVLLS